MVVLYALFVFTGISLPIIIFIIFFISLFVIFFQPAQACGFLLESERQ